jgi:hypothetical protein
MSSVFKGKEQVEAFSAEEVKIVHAGCLGRSSKSLAGSRFVILL